MSCLNKERAKHLLPTPIYNWFKKIFYFSALRSAKRAFSNSSLEPAWLHFSFIDKWKNHFSKVGAYDYGEEGSIKRGQERANLLLSYIKSKKIKRSLELGCMDAMTSAALLYQGIDATGLDLNRHLTDRAIRLGVKLIIGQAEKIPLANESFDLVFSFNTMEHFNKPEEVISESSRLLVPGGYFFIDFDPLYCSPRGLHAYRKINIPYLQFLFKEEDLVSYADRHRLNWSELPYVNKYSAEQFRELWSKMVDKFDIIYYSEGTDLTAMSFITRFPSCFKKTSLRFDNFIISHMRIVARKKI
ncbi:MAG: class I SAM-dependent methyltransferase [Patescibacteria group bacterium]